MGDRDRTLMIIASDRVSEWIDKGEVIERYYNPKNFFKKIHFVLTNSDQPSITKLQRLFGTADFEVHHFPISKLLYFNLFGLNRTLLRQKTRPIVKLAEKIKPDLVRCYGIDFNVFAASEIKKVTQIPFVVSLHTAMNFKAIRQNERFLSRIKANQVTELVRSALQDADRVLPVYQSAVPFLEQIGVTRYQVAYNFLNATHLSKKNSYELHSPVRILCVSRQIKGKDPTSLIRAVAKLDGVELTLVGSGGIHEDLRKLVENLGLSDRITFRPVVSNDEVCRMLPDFDVFACHSDYAEISKSVLEALLTGIPLVINRPEVGLAPELESDICIKVDGSVEGYFAALRRLIEDTQLREQLGNAAYSTALKNWGPEQSESRFVEIYGDVIST